jgi:ABC-type multidrug transport system fused ATPase/permease subunit
MLNTANNHQNTFIKWYLQIKKAKTYYKVFVTLIVSSLILSVLSYAFPLYFSLIIDNLIIRNTAIVYTAILLSFFTSMFMIVLTFFRAYLQGWLHNKLILSLRKEYYEYLLKLPISFFTDFPTGKISQRIFEDVEIVAGTIVGTIINICVEATKVVMIVVILSVIGVKFLVLFASMSVLYILNLTLFKKPIENSSRAIGVKVGDLYSKVYDVIPGIKEVKNYSTEKHESKIFIGENCTLFRLRMKSFVICSVMNIFAESIPAIGICIAFFFAVSEYRSGHISLGFLVMIMSYLQMVRGPIEALVGVLTSLKQGRPAIDRIEEISNRTIEDKAPGINAFNIINKKEFIPNIEFKDVSFGYPNTEGKKVLQNINLSIESGKTAALVGHTGSGKTTITSLILRYYLPDRGNIFISDRDIKSYKINELRKNIAVVPQHPHIFYTSIENNIMYGQKISKDKIIDVCKRIHLHDYITSLPKGYASMVGENGVKLSGGQKQLIAIARAMLKNLPILILDEATSSLDSQTEAVIKDAINQLVKNRTTIAIAHRLSTIINSDEIIVLESGNVKEKGRHFDLLNTEGLYSKLYSEQFKQEYVKNIV